MMERSIFLYELVKSMIETKSVVNTAPHIIGISKSISNAMAPPRISAKEVEIDANTAVPRIGLPEWLAQENPDILCLQETKLQPDQYPGEVFEALGYKSYLYSAQKKGYSGVAILTKQEPDHVEYGMGMEAYDNEGRFIRADFGDLSVVSVYHPSGTSGDERQPFRQTFRYGGT